MMIMIMMMIMIIGYTSEDIEMDTDYIPFNNDNDNNDKNDNDNDNNDTNEKAQLPAVVINDGSCYWMRPGNRDGAPLVRLHNEMLDFVNYISLTKAEVECRRKCLSELQDVIRELWPDATIHVYGSELIGFQTPSSDIDVAVLNVPVAKKNVIELLYDLAEFIKRKINITYLEVISTAKVPIVKFDHVSGVSIDIVLNNDGGIVNGNLLKDYSVRYPMMRPLTLVLKVFMAQRKLRETYSGGIGSFVLSVLVISFLQMRQRLMVNKKQEFSWNLASLLVEFFQMYGGSFNIIQTGISIQNDGTFFHKRAREGEWTTPRRPVAFTIEHPIEQDADVGRNSFLAPKIRKAFEHAHEVLITVLSQGRSESYLGYIIRADDPFLLHRFS